METSVREIEALDYARTDYGSRNFTVVRLGEWGLNALDKKDTPASVRARPEPTEDTPSTIVVGQGRLDLDFTVDKLGSSLRLAWEGHGLGEGRSHGADLPRSALVVQSSRSAVPRDRIMRRQT